VADKITRVTVTVETEVATGSWQAVDRAGHADVLDRIRASIS
jgi:hypothetical protein